MKVPHQVQLPFLLTVLLAADALFNCYAADKPELNGLTDEEAKYAKLYWDYTVAGRVIHPANNSGGGATAGDSEEQIASEGLRTGYRFFVPHFDRLSGLAYVGHGARLRLVLERASSGEALHMGVLGGSISCGMAARNFYGMYAALFRDWLNAAMPPTYEVAKEPAAASVRRSALELALQQGMDWADVDALLDTAAARMGQGDRMLRGAHAEARAAVTRAAFRRGRAALAAASQEDSGAGEGEGGEGDAGSGAGGDGGSTEGEAEGGEGEDAEEEEHEEVQEEEGAAEEEQGEEEGAPAEEDGEGQQGPRHVLHNGAIPGTLSSYMSSCMQYHIPLDKVDIVFVEYAVNDNYRPSTDWDREDRRAFERLLRKLLNLPQRPAVVMVQMYAAKANDNLFWMNAERDFNELARYYGIPAVSLKGTVMPAALSANPPKELQLAAIFNGGKMHPGQGGHVVVAELLITLAMELLRADHHLTNVVRHNLHEGHSGGQRRRTSSRRSLLQSSGTSQHLPRSASRAIHSASVRRAAEARGNDDASVAMLGVLERAVSRPLPPPLAPDNWETGSTTCYLMEQLEAMAVAPVSAGWNWTDEGRNKWGWVALEAKQAIKFKLSTALHNVQSQEPLLLQLSYLQSYRDMGTVKVTCESGCDCDSRIIDAWDKRPVSVSAMANFEVSQHSECVLQVVTQGPARGSSTTQCPEDPTKPCRGSKFKIMGIVVGEEPGGKEGSVDYVRTTTFDIAKAAKKAADAAQSA